ncbi:DUF169 domain-containing protein [Oricola indica]|uniref:DUF169 domain-containing protein n=1 Tax=Oricola indica TaxID=2872591 RepID=UPI003CCC2911
MSPNAEELKERSTELVRLLRLRTEPIGLKLFESREEMMETPGLRLKVGGRRLTTCQLVSQCRMIGYTLGIVSDSVIRNSTCSDVIGLAAASDEHLSGERMNGVWFGNQEAARFHQDQMPRVEKGRYQGLVASPVAKARLDPPDTILLYASPAQMILFINGLQRNNYRRIEMSITGESACADSWGQALASGRSSLSIPCFAERRFGGVADDEMLFALTPSDFIEAIVGLAELEKVGIRYPILPYGTGMDPAEGLGVSYD